MLFQIGVKNLEEPYVLSCKLDGVSGLYSFEQDLFLNCIHVEMAQLVKMLVTLFLI
jgi:hypothetical protein